MRESALKLTPLDNVATALTEISVGADVVVVDTEGTELETVVSLSEIPRGHKIALQDLPADVSVVKYSYQIGRTSQAVRRGEHVHTQNLGSARGRGDL